jgi:hypothetical protein
LGISTESGLPTRWSAHEDIAWKTEPTGFGASPIITGDVVIVTSQIGSYAGRGREYPHLEGMRGRGAELAIGP